MEETKQGTETTNATTPILNIPTPAALREELEMMVLRDLLGPAGGPEEELDDARVHDRYLVGMLAPHKLQTVPEEQDELGIAEEGSEDSGPANADVSQMVSLSPSSIGMSFCVDKDATSLLVTVRWGHYQRVESATMTTAKGAPKKVWRRSQRGGKPKELPLKEGAIKPWQPEIEEQPEVFVKGIVRRSDALWTVTLFLVNGQQEAARLRDQAWLFQPELVVEAPGGAPIFQQRAKAQQNRYSFEERSMAMLYRKQVGFAVGHGVSVHAETLPNDSTCAVRLSTAIVPSNSWFPLVFASLSIPATRDTLGQLIDAHWSTLQVAESVQDIATCRRLRLLERFSLYADDEIWTKVKHKKTGNKDEDVVRPADLKIPEWEVLSNPQTAPSTDDFQIAAVNAPDEYTNSIEQVVLVERLREVRALTGFTRIESLSDYAEDEELPTDHIMRLSRQAPSFVPAAEVRGEGIFLQFREDALSAWLEHPAVIKHNEIFSSAHYKWRTARHIPMPEANYPGIRYVLLHTFAHALMRQLTLECGYTAASIRERIYALAPDKEGGPMAGILLYTAAPDSEGTLGGLVSLGKPELLGWHIAGALEQMQHCASDPLCAEHKSGEDHTLHEAACHACMFVPETSCERGNKYLDRSVLVPTVERDDLAFFPHI